MKKTVETAYSLGQVVKHKYLDFRGVIYDVDPEFNNPEEWYKSIPAAIRPKKDQPFYHVFAENDQVFYSAYVSQQNLLVDDQLLIYLACTNLYGTGCTLQGRKELKQKIGNNFKGAGKIVRFFQQF